MLRRYLFLQGVRSPFFRVLSRALESEGHKVAKVNFNLGDSVHWSMSTAHKFQDELELLPEFYERLLISEAITDVVLFGDQRPIHQAAVAIASRLEIPVHVFEEGYFRPAWITLERTGVNAASLLPKDPDWYRLVGPSLPRYNNAITFTSPFWIRAAHDVAYNSAATLGRYCYPNYRAHGLYSARVEYVNYIRRGFVLSRRKKFDADSINILLRESENNPYYLFPLQLDSDSQIRVHSHFLSIEHTLNFVIESFAKYAPEKARLLIKNHPLDPGVVNFSRLVDELAVRFSVVGRVFFIESGHLPTILDNAAGVITINSTVGGSALIHGCSTIALGESIYNLAGLTFQGSLHDFWYAQHRPDMSLVRNFRSAVICATQVNGGFYCGRGISLAVSNSVLRLTSKRSPLEILLNR